MKNHQLINSHHSNEWYTPPVFVDAARDVMGAIDLDPASNAYANQTVKAKQFYSILDDGYTKEWSGRVWLNPPYGLASGKSNQDRWSAKLIDSYFNGAVSEAILLVNAATGSNWFFPLWDFLICFVKKRIQFFNEKGKAQQPTHSNVIVYLGQANQSKFIDTFSGFGAVVSRVSF